jgi:hypothetical protein
VLAALNLVLAGQPWGVVYGFGLWGAKLAQARGLFDPAAMPSGASRHLQRLSQTLLLDVTSITNIGILGGACGWPRAAPSRRKPLSARQWAVGLAPGS